MHDSHNSFPTRTPLDRELKFVLSKYFQVSLTSDDGFGTELKMSVVKSLLRELERKMLVRNVWMIFPLYNFPLPPSREYNH